MLSLLSMRSFMAGVAGVLFLCAALHGQGSLVPPGVPAPVLRALDQVEPRVPLGTVGAVTNTTIVISSPGSYKLVGPVTVSGANGIEINASGVDLDLGGFTVASDDPSATGQGIVIASASNHVAVRRGTVRGTGFIIGIAYGGSGVGIVIEDVSVANAAIVGISLNTRGVVRRCSVVGASTGIKAREVIESQALGAGTVGIEGQSVSRSEGESPAGTGILADLVYASVGRSTSGIAIVANQLASQSVAYGSLGGKAAFACVVTGANNAVHKDFCH